MFYIFNTIFYQPLLNALVVLVWALPGNNYGLAVIILTLLVNLVLLPITHRAKKSQKKIQELEPKLRKIKSDYKDKKEEQARLTMELYREHGINPFTGFLLLIVQIPLFIALYMVFAKGAGFLHEDLYSFIQPLSVNGSRMFMFVDLTKPNIFLALIAAAAQYFQGALLMPKTQNAGAGDMAHMMQMQMRYVIPIVIFFIGLKFPAALALYWTTMSLFGIVHEGVVRMRARSLTESHGSGNEGKK